MIKMFRISGVEICHVPLLNSWPLSVSYTAACAIRDEYLKDSAKWYLWFNESDWWRQTVPNVRLTDGECAPSELSHAHDPLTSSGVGHVESDVIVKVRRSLPVMYAVHQRSYGERHAVLDQQPVQLLQRLMVWYRSISQVQQWAQRPHFVHAGVQLSLRPART